MQYLPAEEKHIHEITELCKAGFGFKNDRTLAELFRLYLKSGILIVAYEETVVGYIAARKSVAFSRDASIHAPALLISGRGFLNPWHMRLFFAKGAYLASMSVKPEFRRRGVASRLMQAALDSLGTEKAYVEIESKNKAMRAILESLKFELQTPFSSRITGREIWVKI